MNRALTLRILSHHGEGLPCINLRLTLLVGLGSRPIYLRVPLNYAVFPCRLGPRGSLPAAMQCHRCSNLSPNQSGNNCTCAEYQATHSFVQLPLVLPPNTRAAYSNLGFSILGNVLAKALNIAYEDLIADQIIGPMRFTGTGEKHTSHTSLFRGFLTLETF